MFIETGVLGEIGHKGFESARSDGRRSLPGMPSPANARDLDRLRKARSDARERFARQMKLREQIEATAGDLDKVTTRQPEAVAAATATGAAASA